LLQTTFNFKATKAQQGMDWKSTIESTIVLIKTSHHILIYATKYGVGCQPPQQ